MNSGYRRAYEAFERLASPQHDGHLVQTKIGPSGRIDDALLARDVDGLVRLLAKLPPGREQRDVPLGPLLRVQWVPVSGDRATGTYLEVACLDARLSPTFLSLVGEMLERSDSSGRPCVDEIIAVLDAWRAALARSQQELNRNRAIGLFGELSVLERMAEQDPERAMRAWVGPAGAPHDFHLTNSLEVKTYISSNSPKVTIHNIDQLDRPDWGMLHLLAVRIEESPTGETLLDLIARLALHGVAQFAIAERLGVDEAVLSENQRRFAVQETRLYQVTEMFPGIRRSRLDKSSLRGVEDVSYSLYLDACGPSIDPFQLDRILEEL
ncbi:PD-(D/E)XK motif protein [Brachybacterium alimentarium]|uniref:PD-(D/E)XK motif protein n=1 Tax=Brachybacterium alimentarium TaxID=47845 RepID=UPI003FD10A92